MDCLYYNAQRLIKVLKGNPKSESKVFSSQKYKDQYVLPTLIYFDTIFPVPKYMYIIVF